jgi:hypothetical protein
VAETTDRKTIGALMGKTGTKEEAFWERNMLVLMLASGYYLHEGWKVLVINTSEGQLTFHVPPDFDTMGLPEIQPCWDGHTTEEKWERIKQIIRKKTASKKEKCPNLGKGGKCTPELRAKYFCPFHNKQVSL